MRRFPTLKSLLLGAIAGFNLIGIVASTTTLVIVERTMTQFMTEQLALHPERPGLADLAATQWRVMAIIYILLGLVVCLNGTVAWLLLRRRPSSLPQ